MARLFIKLIINHNNFFLLLLYFIKNLLSGGVDRLGIGFDLIVIEKLLILIKLTLSG